MAAANQGNAGRRQGGQLRTAQQLLIFVFGDAGEYSDNGGQKNHSKKRQTNQQIMHLSLMTAAKACYVTDSVFDFRGGVRVRQGWFRRMCLSSGSHDSSSA